MRGGNGERTEREHGEGGRRGRKGTDIGEGEGRGSIKNKNTESLAEKWINQYFSYVFESASDRRGWTAWSMENDRAERTKSAFLSWAPEIITFCHVRPRLILLPPG